MASAGSVAAGYMSVRGPPGQPNLAMGTVPNSTSLSNRPRTIRTHPDSESNSRIVHTYVARQWANGFHNQMREGHLMFVARRHYEDGGTGGGGNGTESTIVTLFQLNQIARDGYKKAAVDIARLKSDHAELSKVSVFDVNQTIANRNMMPEHLLATREYFGSMEHEKRVNFMDTLKARMLNDEMDLMLRDSYEKWFEMWDMDHDGHTAMWLKANELRGESAFRYTTLAGFMDFWNPLGVFQNSQAGSTPMIYQNATRQYDQAPQASVINVVVAKKAAVINIWGNSRKVKPRTPLYLCLRRRQESKDKFTHFEVVPYADCKYAGNSPPTNELSYRDDSGTFQVGHSWYMGWMDEFGRESPPETLRQQAIGNTTSAAQAFEAMGVLARTSKGTIQLGVR
jgi:hypothetical protein